jgi:cytochrome P450
LTRGARCAELFAFVAAGYRFDNPIAWTRKESQVSESAKLTGGSALLALVDLAGASIAAGVIARRRPVVGVLERIQADKRAITRLRRLRQQFGGRPVELRLPGRRIVVVTEPSDVGDILAETPTPFHPASWEKRHALDKFQPHGVLISRGPVRDQRRAINEAALDSAAALHHLSADFVEVIREEARVFATKVLERGELDAAEFTTWWWQLVRRIVLGDAARDHDAVTDDLWYLRKSGNWSFLGRSRVRRRERFFDQLYAYADAADPHSLIGALARLPASGAVDPVGQVPHWLFAFDAAGMATVRAAALLAARPEDRSRCETDDLEHPALRPFLRACVLESVRLWPTTPAILRELTTDTTFSGARFSAGSSVLITVPAFHRDPDLLPFANDFAPDIWLDGRAQQYPQLVPFSAGPAECPGRNLVLFVTSTVLANLLAQLHLEPEPNRLDTSRQLPATFNQFGVRLRASALASAVSGA